MNGDADFTSPMPGFLVISLRLDFWRQKNTY